MDAEYSADVDFQYQRLPPQMGHPSCASSAESSRRWQWGREPHDSPQQSTLEEARDHDEEAPSASTLAPRNFASAQYQQLQQGGLPLHRPSPRTHKAHSRVQRESRARKSTWFIIDEEGHKSILHADKRNIISKFKLGIPIRDMRLLDPVLLTSETGKILVRDNAIVFSIEHVRLIISATVVIIPRDGFEHNPVNARFNSLLEESVIEAAHEAEHRAAAEAAVDTDGDDASSDALRHEVPPLPFELQVLEVALGDVCALVSQLGKELEAVAHPALDALMKSTATGNLERVRKVKTRHQRLFSRVTAVREELQRFLEDDDDMVKMCLTRKRELEQAANQSGAGGNMMTPAMSIPQHGSMVHSSLRRSFGHRHSVQGGSPQLDLAPADSTASQDLPGPQVIESDGSEEAAEAVENLLESYFIQIDSTYDRLVSIADYIQDTEEYINIELDSARNRLIKLEILITAATFAIACFGLIAGILGENLIIPDFLTQKVSGFWLLNGVCLVACIGAFYALLGYIKYKRLL